MLFLDEPTTGLDPRGRAEVWDAVRSLVGGGTTVLLTTQYLEEADQLADRISVDRPAAGSSPRAPPAELKATLGGDRIDVVVCATPADSARPSRCCPRPPRAIPWTRTGGCSAPRSPTGWRR